MAAAAVDVPDIGCFEKTRAGPPGLGSAATRRRRRGRIGARLIARRPGMMVTGWRCMCDDLVVQLFWRGLCTEAGEHGSKYLLGQQQLEESAELLLRIVRGQQGGGGGDNDTAGFFQKALAVTEERQSFHQQVLGQMVYRRVLQGAVVVDLLLYK